MTPLYTNLILAADIPVWEGRAASQGRVLDHWPLYPDRAEPVAVRFVATAEERDEAQSYRYLGLDVPRR